MNLGRIVGVIVAVLVVVGAAVYFFFRYSFTAEGLYKVQTAVGIEAMPPEHHILPGDFKGWAVLRFGVAGAAPLPRDGNALIIEYPSTGSLETSTAGPKDSGFLQREYFRRTPDGLVPMFRAGDIWGEYTMRASIDEHGAVTGLSTGFFVGTMSEFRQARRPEPDWALPELPQLPPG